MAQVTTPEAALPADAAPVEPSSKPIDLTSLLVYQRPTQKQKLRLYEFDAFGPYAFAKAILAAGIQQGENMPPEWGGGAKAYAERAGSDFGIGLVTTTTRYGVAQLLHEDAVYYPCRCKGFLPRARHAVVSTLTARHGENGHITFSISGLVSPYAGSMTALAWYPNRYGVKDGFRMGNYNLAFVALENLALEFVYGGPHSVFRHIASFKTPAGTAPDQRP
jgi:hypothetical protein